MAAVMRIQWAFFAILPSLPPSRAAHDGMSGVDCTEPITFVSRP